MPRHALVFVAGVLAGGLCVYLLRPAASQRQSASPAPGRPAPEARERARESRSDEPGLAECKRALSQQRAELRLVRQEMAQVSSPHRIDDEVDVPAIRFDTASGRAAGGEGDPGAGGESPGQRAEAATEHVRDAVVEHLGVTEDERGVLEDLVCTQRDNLRQLYDDLGDGRMEAEGFMRAVARERTLTNEGLRRSLGSRRYRRFRQLGAIGLLAPTLCEKH